MEGSQQIISPLAWICIKELAPNFYQGWFICSVIANITCV
jgi:hypothetical protein